MPRTQSALPRHSEAPTNTFDDASVGARESRPQRTRGRKTIDADALERKARWRDMTKHQRTAVVPLCERLRWPNPDWTRRSDNLLAEILNIRP
jgi:hypothetical protein